MKISVLSGKGGTGKTTVSLGLFSVLKHATLIDTDVEEPNGHLFLNYEVIQSNKIIKEYPVVDSQLCTLCRACGDFCNFNAILPTKKSVLVYDDLCHDCGGCRLVCPSDAITYQEKAIGIVYQTTVSDKKFYYGDLFIGEVSGVRIISQLKELTKNEQLLIIDSPPGTSCSTVEAITDTDFSIIVTEPTPFGLSDMKLVVEMLRAMKLPFGVVINKSGIGNRDTYHYLQKEGIPLLGEIPYKEEFAVLYSEGNVIAEHNDEFRDILKNIATKVGVMHE